MVEYPKITHLYKYYSYNSNSLSVLINQKLWFSKPASLNDPFDLGINFINYINSDDFGYVIETCKNQPFISSERKKELDEIGKIERISPDPVALSGSWEEVNEKLRNDLRNSGVFCMSELNNNILMWSHYTDGHKGFCVEFVRNPNNLLGDTDVTNPVTYSCNFPSPSPFTDEGRNSCFDDLFLTKSKDWAYEKEWRLINEEGDIMLPFPGDISAIIFGLKMSSRHKETIRSIFSRNANIIYKQAEIVPNSFNLKIVECESNKTNSADAKSSAAD
jgi:Protein of unknown function (DUF2971)